MKVIFCDIDGVLNTPHGKGPFYSEMEEDKLVNLKLLIQETKYDGIVVISDRRYSKVDMNNKLDAFDEFDIHVLGYIRNPDYEIEDDSRGKQIYDYLVSNVGIIKEFIIIDDNDNEISTFFKTQFLKVNRFRGLDKGYLVDGLKMINKK